MDRRRALLTLLLALTSATVPASTQDDLARRVDSIFSAYARKDAPGCAVGIAKDGKPLLTKGYGVASVETSAPITPLTTFNIGSVSKQFTALGALMLIESGTLGLDEDVRRWAPELRDLGATIRVRDLLQHSSGLRDEGALETFADRPIQTMPEWLRLMSRQRGLNFAPGSRHEYSHSDFTLLGLIVERASGLPLAEYLARAIFRPLGMTSTALHDGRGLPIRHRALAHTAADGGFTVRFPASTIVGGSNVYTSVEDFLRWEENFTSGRVGGRELMDRLTSRPTLASGDTIPYAYGLSLKRHRGQKMVVRGGGGGGFRSEMVRFPDLGISVITLCNIDTARPFDLSEAAAAAALGRPIGPADPDPAADSVPSPQVELERFPGLYRSPSRPWETMRIALAEGRLVDRWIEQSYPLTRRRDGDYYSDGHVYRFDGSAPAGRVTLTLEAEWIDARLVRDPEASAGWRPDAATLAAFAGRYTSAEVETTWDVAAATAGLSIRRGDHPARPAAPVLRDLFEGDLSDTAEPFPVAVEFRRDADGRVVGFFASAMPHPYEQAHRIRFDRVP